MCNVPMRTPGGKPVTEMPGLNPRSPVMLLGPALVTVEAPRTANTPAAPRFGAACALICSVPRGDFLNTLDARGVATLLAALETPNTAVVARPTASDSATKLRIPFFMKTSSVERVWLCRSSSMPRGYHAGTGAFPSGHSRPPPECCARRRYTHLASP